MRLNRKGFGHLGVILLIVVLLVAGGAGYFVWDRNRDKPATKTVAEETSDVDEEVDTGAACTAPEGYLVYDNTEARFCFVYPETWGEVSVELGVIDVAYEEGSGWLGTFSDEENASFAFLSNDWDFTGPGRGGPNHAVGFVDYEIFEPSAGDNTNYSIRINTADKQLVGATTDFNIQGAYVWAERVFVESEPYTGIEFQLNAPATSAFDFETAVVGDFVTETQFDQMEVVLNSVTEY